MGGAAGEDFESSLVLELAEGAVKGTIKNISNQPGRVGAPMTMNFTGTEVGGIQRLGLNVLLDMASAAKPRMDLSGTVNGLKLSNFQIPGSGALPVTLTEAVADIDFNADMMGESLKALATANLADVVMTAPAASEEDLLASTLASALSKVSKLTATAGVTGTLSDYTVSISSDMDKLLSQSLGNVVAEQTSALKAQLNSAITSKLSGQTAEAKGSLAGFDGIQAEIEKRLGAGSGLLKGGKLAF